MKKKITALEIKNMLDRILSSEKVMESCFTFLRFNVGDRQLEYIFRLIPDLIRRIKNDRDFADYKSRVQSRHYFLLAIMLYRQLLAKRRIPVDTLKYLMDERDSVKIRPREKKTLTQKLLLLMPDEIEPMRKILDEKGRPKMTWQEIAERIKKDHPKLLSGEKIDPTTASKIYWRWKKGKDIHSQ